MIGSIIISMSNGLINELAGKIFHLRLRENLKKYLSSGYRISQNSQMRLMHHRFIEFYYAIYASVCLSLISFDSFNRISSLIEISSWSLSSLGWNFLAQNHLNEAGEYLSSGLMKMSEFVSNVTSNRFLYGDHPCNCDLSYQARYALTILDDEWGRKQP
jgi:hypothetical protein